jgi:predicted pyridoxine 5'-phosphate oxidase superfamily flavin-nucleotide-binding protein
MLLKKITEILKNREFISVATSDLTGSPNAAPKFLLKIDGNIVYLIDYSMGRTWENLKINPKASLSFVDTDALIGYQINGLVEIIDKGPRYDNIFHELEQKEIDLSIKRIIEGVSKEKRHRSFEVAITDKFVVLKVDIKEIVEIGPRGEIKRQNFSA